MELLPQPLTTTIGDKLKRLLEDNKARNFETFSIIVAYVKSSGVRQLAEPIGLFKKSGGKVRAVVGVDQNTSVQGLRMLLPLCDEAYVYNNESLGSTFHPKVYVFERTGHYATVFIGSSNLTQGGLYTNYEFNCQIDFDLSNPSHMASFGVFTNAFQRFSAPSALSKQLTPEVIDQLLKDRYLSDEDRQRSLSRPRARGSRDVPRPRQFGSESFPVPRVDGSPTNDTDKTLVSPQVETESRVLVRYIPRAGGRTSQVHFTREIVEEFFDLKLGQSGFVNLQQKQPDGTTGPEETRKLVYSRSNKNPKIEVSGAKVLGNYPAGSERPIIIFERTAPRSYKYMILRRGEEGYDRVSRKLDSQQRKGLALSSWMTDLDPLVAVWEDYPH